VDEAIAAAVGDGPAYVVGGAVRDELLGRPVLDLDVACVEPEAAAAAFRDAAGGALFPLSERHGAWRVAFPDGRTVDFTPLRSGIEDDLATRDFTINAVAVPVGGGEAIDPFAGREDIAGGVVRAVCDSVFADDPLRLLRAVRFEDELGFRLEKDTEALLRADAGRVSSPAGERILDELGRISARGYRRLDELGLLGGLGGRLRDGDPPVDTPEFRLVWFLGEALGGLPVSAAVRRFARVLSRARPPADLSPREVHRFRRETEPWALEAAAYLELGDETAAAVRAAREAEPPEPLLRGDELGVEPGPEVGRLLALVEEERAAGTIATRDEALALVRRARETS